ncbi:fungal-specific transcription factor domain-domain-containing protein [Protomyces lactucae-debilis]|uniref:Fungal-specific transcription factor domain-domain-containing protein n=1 Tax=Protomyces lactucae-debilis TaxID=2754530 RepID=A0A1Y2F2X8_PROLT|nr:fungal-specific transcription factor domain-containing protein [Protomyces lactucae-debilis]ORY78258.1 fungal-specific transcription factor domain-domain-containing protein [Protomyces lactucae-debilis]
MAQLGARSMQNDGSPAPMNKVPAACDDCKKRHQRCNGEQPCEKCVRHSRQCQYSERIDRSPLTRKYVDELEAKLAEALDRLSRANSVANAEVTSNHVIRASHEERPQKRRRHVVRSYAGYPQAPNQSAPYSRSRNLFDVKPEFARAFEWDETDFDHLSAMTEKGVGSLAFSSGMSGFLGTSSSAAALQVLSTKTGVDNLPSEHQPNAGEVISYNPYSVSVKPHARPPQLLEEHLIQQFYWHHHPLYPLTFEPIFRAEYHNKIPKPKPWPALLNIILALGTWYSSDSSEEVNDIAFFRVAQANLSLDIFSAGDLPSVHVLALMSDYLFKRNKCNTGYLYLGLAIRMAVGIGVHREYTNSAIAPWEKEIRRRTWCTLFNMEVAACIMLGRPLCIDQFDVLPPGNLSDLDLPFDSKVMPPSVDRPTAYTCSIYHGQLSMIAMEVHTRLLLSFAPSNTEVADLHHRLELFQQSLPPYVAQEVESEPGWLTVPRLLLHWRLLNMQIILQRPAIFQLANEQFDAPSQNCLEAASESIRMISAHLFGRQSGQPVTRGLAYNAMFFAFHASIIPLYLLLNFPYSSKTSKWRSMVDTVLVVLRLLMRTLPHISKCIETIERHIQREDRRPSNDNQPDQSAGNIISSILASGVANDFDYQDVASNSSLEASHLDYNTLDILSNEAHLLGSFGGFFDHQ